MRIGFIASHMPAAKIIHCRRNPMDNILSMYRSNLSSSSSYTANIEDAAKVLIAQEQAMQIQKKDILKKYSLSIMINLLMNPRLTFENFWDG